MLEGDDIMTEKLEVLQSLQLADDTIGFAPDVAEQTSQEDGDMSTTHIDTIIADFDT